MVLEDGHAIHLSLPQATIQTKTLCRSGGTDACQAWHETCILAFRGDAPVRETGQEGVGVGRGGCGGLLLILCAAHSEPSATGRGVNVLCNEWGTEVQQD